MSFITNNKSKAFILYLFGFFLFSASPVFADDFEDGFKACKEMQWEEDKRRKSHCFRDLAADLIDLNEHLVSRHEDNLKRVSGSKRLQEVYKKRYKELRRSCK
jgi:hypothetical protein